MPSDPFSVAQALQLGRFVLAAYDLFAQGDPPGFAPPDGYALVSKVYADDITDGVPDFKVFGFIAQSGTDVIVAIRGTEGVFEWIRDFEFELVTFPYADAGRTEQGFTGFYSTFRTGPQATESRVADVLTKLTAAGTVNTLRIAGHSLGCALATMLALDLAANGRFSAPVAYTFASPRIGDKVFSGIYDRFVETSWRISNLNDIVPHLPPQLAGYAHTDAELPINSDDRCRHNINCWHSLETYLNTLDASQALEVGCVP